ncbi:MAG TPA: hypothetical protein VHN80_26965 [Kineosporiaceae bacterium]|nr:hypothetical protein [Kineosporiaceae bacterium]
MDEATQHVDLLDLLGVLSHPILFAAYRCRLLPDVGAGRYRGCMDGVTTYEQLQAMTPEQRRAHFYASIVLDPTTLRPGMQRRLEEMGAELDERQRVREERLRGQAS